MDAGPVRSMRTSDRLELIPVDDGQRCDHVSELIEFGRFAIHWS